MVDLIRKYPVFTYVLCCLVPVHLIMWSALGLGASPESLQPLKLPFAILPTAAAFLLTFITIGEKGVIELARRTFIKKTNLWVYLFGLLVFPSIALSAMAVRYRFDGYFPGASEWQPWYLIVGASPFLLAIPGLFEEYGWRGFMQRRLQKRFSVFTASLLVGITWGAWHMMDFLMGNWSSEIFVVGLFFIYVIGVSLIIGLVFDWSGGSIVSAMIVHFSANFVNFFIPLWLLEPGLMTPLVYVALIWVTIIFLFAGRWIKGRRTGVNRGRKDE